MADDQYERYEHADIVQRATKFHQLSRDYTQPYFDRFIDNYKHYFIRTIDEAVEEDPDSYPFYSQIHLPINYQVVETVLPRMFNRMMTFSIATEGENDERDEAALRELLRYQMNHPYLIDDPIFARLVTALKEEFITGNAWGSVPWMKKELMVEEYVPYSPELGIPPEPGRSDEILDMIQQYGLQPRWQLMEVPKTAIDAPVFQHRSVFHVYPDPKKKRVGDFRRAIIEESMTMDEIMDMVNANQSTFKNIDALKQMESNRESGKQDYTNYDQELAEIFNSSDERYNTEDGEGQFKVWFMPEKKDGQLSIIVNEKLCIFSGKNPNGDAKMGLFLMKDIPVPHELYAWGEPDPIKRLEDGMSDQFNMRNDSVLYDLLRMWKLDPSSLIDGEEFIPEPGSVIQMNDMAGLEPLETGVTKASAYREYQEWEQVIQNVSGVTDYATGMADPSMNKTMGGVELLQQAANARFQMKLQLFENLGLKAMGTMYVQRNLRFFDTPQGVITQDKEKMIVTPDQLRRLKGNVHFIVDSGSTEATNKSTEIKKWEMVAELISKEVPLPILRKSLYAIGVQDADGVIQEIQEEQQRQLQVLQAQNAQGVTQNAQPNTTPVPQASITA